MSELRRVAQLLPRKLKTSAPRPNADGIVELMILIAQAVKDGNSKTIESDARRVMYHILDGGFIPLP